jgi:hypothetical protein
VLAGKTSGKTEPLDNDSTNKFVSHPKFPKIDIDNELFSFSLDACLPVARGERWGEGVSRKFRTNEKPL